ncbi:MAG: nuclear transport factor 2 family protein [Betaproteobacteria bacterium]
MAAAGKDRFATPEDAARAFYDAFERSDIEAMMEVWADDDEIYCIHPGGPRNVGPVAVRSAWAEIFSTRARLKFQLEQPLLVVGGSLAVQSVLEYLQINDEPAMRGPALATNIYTRTARGWRILAHHAAVAPAAPALPAASRSGTLH